MAVGNCLCGRIRIDYSNQPITSALCHCIDCRRLTGAAFSYSFVVQSADLKITGAPKETPKVADSGSYIRNYFCSDCGTPLYGVNVDPSGKPSEITILRAGIFEDPSLIMEGKPGAELFIERRLPWVYPIEGAQQHVGMPPVPGQ